MRRTKLFLALVAVLMVSMMVGFTAPAMADKNGNNNHGNNNRNDDNCCNHNDRDFFNCCDNNNRNFLNEDFEDVFDEAAFLVPVVVFVIDDNCDGFDDDDDGGIDEDAVCDFDSFDLFD
jgi:hypothetical protein